MGGAVVGQVVVLHGWEQAGGRAVVADDEADRAVALNDVVAELAEDHVVGGTAGDVVVAEQVVGRAGLDGECVVEQRDHIVAPRRVAVRVELGRAVRVGHDRERTRVSRVVERNGDVQRAAGVELLESQAGEVVESAGAVEIDVVTEDQVAVVGPVETVAGSTTDHDVVAVCADHLVGPPDRTERRHDVGDPMHEVANRGDR